LLPSKRGDALPCEINAKKNCKIPPYASIFPCETNKLG
jgi:hypothetical protein